MAELRPATRAALARVLPPEASTANPVDMIASADAARYRAALDLVKRDPGVDGIIAIFVSPIMIDAYEVARAIAEAADGTKPVLSVFMGKQRSAGGGRGARRPACAGLPVPRGGGDGDGGARRATRRCATRPRGGRSASA